MFPPKLSLSTLLFLSILLTGCFATSEDSNDSADKPSAQGTLTLGKSSVSFDSVQGGELPPAQTINLQIDGPEGASVVAGFPASVAQSPWLTFSAGPTSLTIQIANTDLTPGTYDTTLRVSLTDQDGNTLAYRDLSVSYTVSPTSGTIDPVESVLTLDASSISFDALQNAAVPPAQSVGVQINAAAGISIVPGYPPSVAQPSWLAFSVEPDGLKVNPTTTDLAVGTYTTTIRVWLSDANNNFLGYQDLAVSYAIRAQLSSDTEQLDFTYLEGDTVPSGRSVSIGGSGLDWTASADKDWVTLDHSSGTAPSNLVIGLAPEGLAPGTYAANVAVTQTGTAQSLNIAVNVVVSPTEFTLSSTSVSISGVNGATLPKQTVNIALNNGQVIDWSAVASEPWITLDSAAGTTPGALTIGIDPQALASGAYVGNVNISGTYNGRPIESTIDLNLGLSQAEITFDQDAVILGGQDGLDFASVALNVNLNTGVNEYPWTASVESGGAAWLTVDKMSGTVSATSAILTLDADRSQMSGGTYSSNLTFVAQVNGDTVTKTLPVTLNLSAHELVVSRDGLAFVKTPTIQRLSTTIYVSDTYGLNDTPWTVTADQDWLTVSRIGLNAFYVAASPYALADEQVHYANISVSSGNPAVENIPVVQVGLWKSASDPIDIASASSYTTAVTDPVSPYVYLHSGGTDIAIVNSYTGEQVATIASVAANLGDMVVSTDGSRLFAVDTTNAQVAIVDLSTLQIVGSFDLSAFNSVRLAYAKPAGHPVLITGDGYAYDETGGQLASHGMLKYRLAASADSTQICGINVGLSPYTLSCYDLDYSTLNGGIVKLSAERTRRADGSNAQDLAISPNDDFVYVASGAPYVFNKYDSRDLSLAAQLPAAAYPNNVELRPDGRLVGGIASYSSSPDLWLYGTDGVTQNELYLTGDGTTILPAQMRLTGDGNRAVALSGTTLHIMSLP